MNRLGKAAMALWMTGSALGATTGNAQEVRIGVITSLSGVYAVGGKQMQNGINAFLKENGETVAGRKVQVLYRDAAGANPDAAKRLAQELITRDKVNVLAGFDFTPSALAVAPLATQAKIPMVVMNAASSIVTTRSPYIVRTSFTLPQTSYPMGQWAAKQGIKTAYILVADYAPGLDAATWFKKAFTEGKGQIVGEVNTPLANPDFAPYLQKIKDAKPDAVFAFMPVGEPVVAFFKGYRERGLDKAGIKLLSPEGWVDDDVLKVVGEASVGAISTGFYTPSNPSAKNKAFVAAYRAVSGGLMEANYLAVGAYDGMALIYEAIKKTRGAATDGAQLVEAMKGVKLESPRGMLVIDPETRDAVNTVYVRRVEMVGGRPVAVDFDKVENVKDPGK